VRIVIEVTINFSKIAADDDPPHLHLEVARAYRLRGAASPRFGYLGRHVRGVLRQKAQASRSFHIL
jgi:hypothetical protein